ncbi:hypothetical protein [Algicola sagamiensis]|uniref:hypothetical protein n=1 Tax=Algicola sagamiensis TaxID=163869 RepID=UPI000375AEF7|nr:hypothetical protein [Algicola sagamiensis]
MFKQTDFQKKRLFWLLYLIPISLLQVSLLFSDQPPLTSIEDFTFQDFLNCIDDIVGVILCLGGLFYVFGVRALHFIFWRLCFGLYFALKLYYIYSIVGHYYADPIQASINEMYNYAERFFIIYIPLVLTILLIIWLYAFESPKIWDYSTEEND